MVVRKRATSAPPRTFKLPQRFKDNKESVGPGPGGYEHRTHIGTSHAFSITGKPTHRQGEVTPGPGTYQYQLPARGGVSLSGRHKLPSTADAPGPGAYSCSPEVQRKGPAVSMAGRPVSGHIHDTPGPGAYDSQMAHTGPAFSLSSRQDTKLSHESPGPGAYDNSSHIGASPAFSVSNTTIVSQGSLTARDVFTYAHQG